VSDIELDYDQIMQNALRRVVHDVLTITADLKETPGDHHFYIEFLTGAPDVSIPDHLRETYPERMTIVLHHQFEDLDVNADGFGVTLWFKGVSARLEIPYDAITSFADPSAKFGLRFQEDEDSEESTPHDAPELIEDNEPAQVTALKNSAGKKTKAEAVKDKKSGETKDSGTASDGDDKDSSADVVSLDAFRKK